MRIISEFKDYYDGVAKYGIDRSIIYLRKTEKVCSTRLGIPIFDPIRLPNSRVCNFDSFTIGFCGKLYMGVRLRTKKDRLGPYSYSTNEEYIYNREKISGVVEEFGSKYHYQDLMEFYSRLDTFKSDGCFEKAPIFYFARPDYWLSNIEYEITYNPRLNQFEFFKVLDASMAFQTLQSFISSKALPEKEIPKISNNDMIESKGFSLKESFRKSKQ